MSDADELFQNGTGKIFNFFLFSIQQKRDFSIQLVTKELFFMHQFCTYFSILFRIKIRNLIRL